tara:strand:- start:5062 stop:5814 length:753 start_codon:yes stop_codon:yes gene_type:complete
MSLVSQQLSYGTRLKNVSFTVPEGQLVGIIGANGAGKTTLLHTLTGQLEPSAGSVHFAGVDISQLEPLQRRQLFGFLPQNPSAHAEVSVAHFLQSGLVNLPLKVSASVELARVVKLLQLEDYLGRPFTQLSGGEQRRVQLARALLGDQPWLVCDEPTASLDLHYQLHVMQLLKSLAAQGKTITVALHDLSLAARFCDQLVLLRHGALLAADQPAAVLTDANLAQAFGIKARWLCTEQGVALLPSLLDDQD